MSFQRLWHKSYIAGVPAEFEVEKVTMAEALRRTAKKYPDRIAVIYMGKRFTYRELENLVNRFTHALVGLGVREKDKVAMLLPNIPQLVIADHAAYRAGAVTSMNNPLYTERELAHQLNDSDATVLATLDLLLPRALKLKEATKIQTIITCHISDYLPFPIKQLFPYIKKGMYRKVEPQAGVYEFMDLMKESPDSPVEIKAEWDSLAALIYTGGTTGVSKGAMLSHANVSSVVQLFSNWFPDLKGTYENLLGIYPIFHSAGYSVSQNLPIWNGWCCTLVPKPEPGVITDMLGKFKPTFLPGVPTIYTALLRNEKFRKMDLSFVKGYFGGAAPLPEETLNQLKKLHGAIIHDVYGATENTAFATCTPWHGRVKIGTVGIPLPNTDVKIVDAETGKKELPLGEAGEICIKGPQVMKGYYKKPDETEQTIRDGWFYTGDIGFFDPDGYLTISDRKKDMIVASGFNIFPKEIDEILYGHPKILEACCIGVPDEYRGETLKAYIVVKPGEKLTKEEVISFCKDKLTAYKVPKDLEFIDELPKSAIGKILRREVREIDRKRREGTA
ncbi:MAG TPA: long-chain fatty acid--CoA ligase [Deltaproteobacteria bacterium]|nr:long-chain fatty acid--CoA ligase [Deltaproteobacteria bacterium]HQI01466.1 long-chain fatty acid--CoA ligase [Deltaproteobacteria bacterium]HQJ09218.1 long-chain fatty acid--CoA ligase [Deltaproteobacteria bacterium]